MVTDGGHRRTTRMQGLTLVEMLVVLLVMGVLLGLAIPAWGTLRSRQHVQAQAEDFRNSLVLARAHGLLHQRRVSVCAASVAGTCDASAGWQSGWLVFVDDNRNGQRDAGERLLLRREAASGVRITGNSTVTHLVGYNAEGRSETLTGAFQAGTVSVCVPGLSEGWRVVINSLGRARLEKFEAATCPG